MNRHCYSERSRCISKFGQFAYILAHVLLRRYSSGTSVSQINGLFTSNNCVTDSGREPNYDSALFGGAGGLEAMMLPPLKAQPRSTAPGVAVSIWF